MEHESLSSLLTGTSVASVLNAERQLVWLRHDDSIGTVLQTLSSNAILAAPVFVGQPSVSTLIGFVGCWDVLSALLHALPAQQPGGAAGSNGGSCVPHGIRAGARRQHRR